MKKIICLCAAAFIAIFSAACGGNQKDIEISKLAGDLLAEVDFSEELNPVDDKMVGRLYNIGETVDRYVYVGSGATAEEIAVFEFSNESEAQKGLEAAEQRIEDQKLSFESYVPAELDRLENAIVEQSGRYVVVCVAAGNKAEEVIDRYID